MLDPPGELLAQNQIAPLTLRNLIFKESSWFKICLERMRQFYCYNVFPSTGGQFGASWELLELTDALATYYNYPEDQNRWGRGASGIRTTKSLTGRRDQFPIPIGVYGGLSGFPKAEGSDYDTFGVGPLHLYISSL